MKDTVRMVLGKTVDEQRRTTAEFIRHHPDAKVVSVPRPQGKAK
jgi:hypothetical protein